MKEVCTCGASVKMKQERKLLINLFYLNGNLLL